MSATKWLSHLFHGSLCRTEMTNESNQLTSLRETLESQQVRIYFGAVVLGAIAALTIPGMTALEIGINPALAFMLFVTFLQVPLAELRLAFSRFRFLGVLLLTNFVIVPVLVGPSSSFCRPIRWCGSACYWCFSRHASTMSSPSRTSVAPTPVSCWLRRPRS